MPYQTLNQRWPCCYHCQIKCQTSGDIILSPPRVKNDGNGGFRPYGDDLSLVALLLLQIICYTFMFPIWIQISIHFSLPIEIFVIPQINHCNRTFSYLNSSQILLHEICNPVASHGEWNHFSTTRSYLTCWCGDGEEFETKLIRCK